MTHKLGLRSEVAIALAVLVMVILGIGCSDLASMSSSGADSIVPTDINKPDLGYVHDFGILLPRAEASHTFTIYNPGPTEWILRRVSESCACTTGQDVFSAKKQPLY